jgi:hypothetical protein
VTGTVYNPDETLYNGEVVFKQPVLLRHSDGTAIVPGPLVTTVIEGALDVDLLYVDSPGWTPQDWAYEVVIKRGSLPRSYTLAPLIADGSVNLGDLRLPDYTPTPGVEYVTPSDLQQAIDEISAGAVDWSAILNKPSVFPADLSSLATVATSGAYTDLSGKPTIPSTKADVGLGNVDNTSDVNKPVSTAQQTALNLKAPIASPTFTGTVGGLTKAMVGLGNVDNTADTAKPVSTAQAAAIANALSLLGVWTPASQNLVAANGDPGMVQSSTVLATAGTLYGTRLQAVGSAVTNIVAHFVSGGGTLTTGQCFAGLYNDAGALLGAGAVTADQAAAWATSGLKTMPLSVAQAVTPGAWYKVCWFFNGVTGPGWTRFANVNNAIQNVGLVAPNFRWFTANTGLTTAMPANIGTETSGTPAFLVTLT